MENENDTILLGKNFQFELQGTSLYFEVTVSAV